MQHPNENQKKHRLTRHLIIILCVKLALLFVLWSAFIKPYRVSIDAETMSSRLVSDTSDKTFRENRK